MGASRDFRVKQNAVKPLSDEEIRADLPADLPVFVTPQRFAELTGVKVKTIYEWIARGRLKGAVRKRGKHNLIWPIRAIQLIFDGPKWSDDEPNR